MEIKVYTLFSTISSDQAFTTAYHYSVNCFKVWVLTLDISQAKSCKNIKYEILLSNSH